MGLRHGMQDTDEALSVCNPICQAAYYGAGILVQYVICQYTPDTKSTSPILFPPLWHTSRDEIDEETDPASLSLRRCVACNMTILYILLGSFMKHVPLTAWADQSGVRLDSLSRHRWIWETGGDLS